MTSGAPARGTEIIPLLASNSMINRRNLFLDPKSKLFLIRLRYSKVLATTGMERNAVRAIPRAPSHILLVYLVVVEPFIHYLHQALKLRNRRSLLFSIQGDLPTSRQVSDTLRHRTSALIGQGIQIHSWRHLAQGFIRYGMGERMEGDSIEAPELSELENEALAAGQAHHSVRTAMLVYGRPQVQFGNLPINQQAAYIDFSQRWHSYIGMGPDFDFLSFLYQGRPLPQAPQATAKTPQGLSTSSFPLNQPCLRFWWQRSASSPSPKIPIGQFNAFMGSTTPTFTPIDPNVTEGIPDGDPRLAELEPGQRLRLLAHQPFPQTPRGLQAPDLLLGLFQEFMGTPQAEFRSAEQRECLYHLLKPTPFLLMALPTAGGKTTLFLLAASLAWAHTTVLVVPLVSLKLNLQSKLQNLGLPWVNWEDQ